MKCCDIVGVTSHVKLIQINLMAINAHVKALYLSVC